MKLPRMKAPLLVRPKLIRPLFTSPMGIISGTVLMPPKAVTSPPLVYAVKALASTFSVMAVGVLLRITYVFPFNWVMPETPLITTLKPGEKLFVAVITDGLTWVAPVITAVYGVGMNALTFLNESMVTTTCVDDGLEIT